MASSSRAILFRGMRFSRFSCGSFLWRLFKPRKVILLKYIKQLHDIFYHFPRKIARVKCPLPNYFSKLSFPDEN